MADKSSSSKPTRKHSGITDCGGIRPLKPLTPKDLNTGQTSEKEKPANALGVKVKAPNDVLFITSTGKTLIGENGEGWFITYKPNERRRLK